MRNKFVTAKGGFALLGWALLLVLLTLITLIVMYGIFYQYNVLTRAQLEAFQNFYYAEFGIYRAKWLIDGDHSGSYPAPNVSIPGSGGITTNITITENVPLLDYTITSTVDTKTITVKYENAKIISWD